MKTIETRQTKNNLLIIGYIIIQMILLLLIRFTEFKTPSTIYCRIMFCVTVVNSLMMLYLFIRYGRKIVTKDNKTKKDLLIPIGFGLMFIADFFLCYLDDIYIAGYIAFCLMEICYMLYLGISKLNIIIRLIVFIIMLVIAYIVKALTLTNFFGLLNMALILCNMIYAWIKYVREKDKSILLFSIGISLFLISDTAIVIRTLTNDESLIHMIAAFIVWTFYVPANVFILLSYHKKMICVDGGIKHA